MLNSGYFSSNLGLFQNPGISKGTTIHLISPPVSSKPSMACLSPMTNGQFVLSKCLSSVHLCPKISPTPYFIQDLDSNSLQPVLSLMVRITIGQSPSNHGLPLLLDKIKVSHMYNALNGLASDHFYSLTVYHALCSAKLVSSPFLNAHAPTSEPLHMLHLLSTVSSSPPFLPLVICPSSSRFQFKYHLCGGVPLGTSHTRSKTISLVCALIISCIFLYVTYLNTILYLLV